MPTYFNYVEREADSYVNWADVGRDMSNTIDDIQRVREEKKALIEKTYREDLKFIQDNPSGEHETMNAWSLGVAQSSAEMMRLQNTMLKQGKLSLPNYLTFRQNITDSVEKIYTVNSQLQEAFKEVNDRTKAGDNQQLERETKVLLEKYGNLQDTEAYINPLNGTIYLGLTEIVEEDGKSVRRLKKGDGTYLSPDQLQAAAVQKFDAYNEQADLDKWVESTGVVVQDLREIGGERLAGLITSVTDVTSERILSLAKELPEGSKLSETQMKALEAYVADFKKGEMGYINGILANPYHASALLTDRIKSKNGKTYNIVFNKDEQKTEYDLYVEKTPDGKFTPIIDENTEVGKAQKQALVDFLQGQLRVKYDRKVEMKPYNEPTPPRPIVQGGNYDARAADERESYIKQFEMYHKLFTGGFDVKQTILNNLKQAASVVSDETFYDKKTGKLIITPSDPDKEKIVYDFQNPPAGVDTRDLVFSIMNLIDPALNSKYGAYAKSVPIKPINTELPIDKQIQTAQENLDFLKKEKEKGGALRWIYESQIPDAEKTLKDLMDEQKRMRARQGQGGRQGELDE